MTKRRATLEGLKAQLARPASLIELGDRGPTVPGPRASWFGRVNVALRGEEWPEDSPQWRCWELQGFMLLVLSPENTTFSAVPGPLASWFGRVDVALPGEAWPEDGDERPMVPIAQFNLTEAPYVPPALAGLELIAVFFGQSESGGQPENGDGWLLRAYASIDALVPLEAPPGALTGIWSLSGSGKPITARPIRYKLLAADYPDYEDLPPDLDEELADEWSERVAAESGSKLGGWPKLIQSQLTWAPWHGHPANPEFAFQLDAMPKTNFSMVDDGVCYFGRGTGESRDVWTFEYQIA